MKKKLFAMIFAAVFCLGFAVPAFADSTDAADADTYGTYVTDGADVADGADGAEIDLTADEAAGDYSVQYSRVLDNAGLLTEDEVLALSEKLDGIRYSLDVDVVVVTVNGLGGSTASELADDIYDECGFGYGEEHDGILLLISMEEHDWATSTRGRGIRIFTDSKLEKITDSIVPYLSKEDYVGAFDLYADMCDEMISEWRSDSGDSENSDGGIIPLPPLFIPICLVVGLVAALIAVSVMKAKLKSVSYKAAADDYVVKGSLNITESRELFLYSTVTRTEKPKNDNDSGSSTHESSSGATHGGSSGKF